MKRLLLLLSRIRPSALGQDFQMIDRIDGLLIKHKRDSEQNHVCRASLLSGGSWLSARARLDINDALVVPQGLVTPVKTSVDSTRKAVRRSRSNLLYS